MAILSITGQAHKYGDNINTDIITPGKYMEMSIEEMAAHVMEGIDLGFVLKVRSGDILIAGYNFGSGSSRETAPLALKQAGISAIIAKSFARIFFRNSINVGLPVFEIAEVDGIRDGDILYIDMDTNIIKNKTRNMNFYLKPLPERLKEMLLVGGLVAQLETRAK